MGAIKLVSIVLIIAAISLRCSEDDNEIIGPDDGADSIDVPLTDEQSAFLESLEEVYTPLEEIILPNGENVRAYLEANDPEFLQSYPSGKVKDTPPRNAAEQKLKFLARMYAMGNYLVDDARHTHPAAGANSPAQTGLAYSWGSKDHNIRQIPPTASGCMDKKIYGLDCSGMVWEMTRAAGITVQPKYNFFVEYISDANKWTNAFKASGVYKDLKMKDMGMLPKSKIKNGDVILWKQHVGIYLYGTFYQSNGTSRAPGCQQNLSPNRGPRAISLSDVLSWNSLGRYKVLRITHEFDFSLHVEVTHDDPCGYRGSNYWDAVDMDIHVKDEEVTFSNIRNYRSTVNPTTIAIVASCTMTSQSGPTGEFNVTSATGTVDDVAGQKDPRLNLVLINTGATTTSCLLKCPNMDDVDLPYQTYEFEDKWFFVLDDSTQRVGSTGQFGIYAELKVKE